MYDLTAERMFHRIPVLKACMDAAICQNVNAGSSLLVIKDGQELLYLESGHADLQTGRRLARNSIFRCYSMTKPITSCAAMLLIQDGIIDLWDPVSKYIDSFRHQVVDTPEGDVPAAREVVIMDLLNMTAGLRYDGQDTTPQRETTQVFEDAQLRLGTDRQMGTIEFAERIGRCRLSFQPGSSWNYSVCADVLGAVIEKATGMSFGAFVQKKILEPLGMADSGFSVPDAKRSRLVTAYQNDPAETAQNADRATADGWLGNGYAALVPYTGNHLAIRNDGGKNAFESGGAGLFSTIDDYAKFAWMLMNDGVGDNGSRIMSSAAVRYMTTHGQFGSRQAAFETWAGLEGYTYGNLLRVMRDPSLACVPTNHGEYGWDGWLGTFMSNDPATGVTILLMQNKKDGGTANYVRKMRHILYL